MKPLKNIRFKNFLNTLYPRDDEGRVIIDMHVKDDADFLSVFSASDTPVVSDEVACFLENTARGVLPNEQLALHIKSDCIDDGEKVVYTAAVKKYYAERYAENKRELRHLGFVALILAILGVLVLAFSVWLEYRYESVIWSEVVDIAAWVFLWEAVDVFFFKTREIKFIQKRYAAFIDMKISYEDIGNENNHTV